MLVKFYGFGLINDLFLRVLSSKGLTGILYMAQNGTNGVEVNTDITEITHLTNQITVANHQCINYTTQLANLEVTKGYLIISLHTEIDSASRNLIEARIQEVTPQIAQVQSLLDEANSNLLSLEIQLSQVGNR